MKDLRGILRMPSFISAIPAPRFGTILLNHLPKGKTHVARDNRTGDIVTFSKWAIDNTKNPPEAVLQASDGSETGRVPVRTQDCPCGDIRYYADTLDLTQKSR